MIFVYKTYLSNICAIMAGHNESEKTMIYCLKLCQKCLYLASLLFVFAALFAAIYQGVKRFLEYPTYTETTIVPQQNASFPAISFCATPNDYKEDVLKKNGIPSIGHYSSSKVKDWTSNDTGVSPQQLFLDATYSFNERIKGIKVRYLVSNHTNGSISEWLNINELNTGQGSDLITEQRHRTLGRCYTFQLDESRLRRGVYYVKIKFRLGSKIYLHRKGEFLNLDGRMGYVVYENDSFQSQLTMQEIVQLPDNKREKCSTGVYDDCMYSSLVHLMQSATEDNCTVPWVLDNSNICTKEKDIDASFRIWYNHATNQKRDCAPPCRTMVVELGAKNNVRHVKNPGKTQISIYFSPYVTKITEKYLYSPLGMLADVGGYIGLLLGYSFLHLAELVYRMFSTKIQELEDQNKIRNIEMDSRKGSNSHGSDRLSITITRC